MKITKSSRGFTIETSQWEWDRIGIANKWIDDSKKSRYFPEAAKKKVVLHAHVTKQIKTAQAGGMENVEPEVAPASGGAGSSGNPLNGKTNEQARRIVRNIVDKPSKGYFSDQYWQGPKGVFEALNAANIDWSITKTEYGVSKTFQETYPGEKWRIPNDYKVWQFAISFTNNKGRPTVLHCTLTAHGAGTVTDPLSRYDMSVVIG